MNPSTFAMLPATSEDGFMVTKSSRMGGRDTLGIFSVGGFAGTAGGGRRRSRGGGGRRPEETRNGGDVPLTEVLPLHCDVRSHFARSRIDACHTRASLAPSSGHQHCGEQH